jgi:hypothetical protein
LPSFFYVPDFFYVSKKVRKSLGHRKMSVLVFFTNKEFKKQGKNDRVPTFSEKNIEKVWDTEKCWDSVIF